MITIRFDSKFQIIAQLFDSIRFEMNKTIRTSLSKSKSNQIKIYIAPYVHEVSEELGGWITCSRRVGIDEFLNVF